MSWLEKLVPSRIIRSEKKQGGIPEGLWTKCKACDTVLYQAELERSWHVCPKCAHHMRVGARARLSKFLDAQPQVEIGETIGPVDTLKFRDTKKYKDRITQTQKKTQETDALIVMRGSLKGLPLVAAAFEFQYMGGSMGSVVGERFVRGVELAIEEKIPFICFTASGGARMQEGLMSLMQMAKTSAALTRLAEAGLPYIVILTDPTTGGVSASLAMLGDVQIAEPNALIGFAGPRVIQDTVREVLPEGFQRSEFLLEHGVIDMIVDRRELQGKVANLLSMMMGRPSISA